MSAISQKLLTLAFTLSAVTALLMSPGKWGNAVSAQATPSEFFLKGTGSNGNPTSLFLNNTTPTAATPKYIDSSSLKYGGGNPWKDIGIWTADPALTTGSLTTLGDLTVWLGLKNGDGKGTQFDLRAEVYKNDALVMSGETYCIHGVTPDPSMAKEVVVSFGSFSATTFDGASDMLSLRVLTRIGTDGLGGFCGGHRNAGGLRLYFDAISRPSKFGATTSPTPTPTPTPTPLPFSWTRNAPMEANPRFGPGVVTGANGKIYVIGGGDGAGGAFAIVEEYDPATDTWARKAPMPTARWLLGAAIGNNGKIYVIGGLANWDQPVSAVEEYDPLTDTWSTKAPMPFELVQSNVRAAVASNGKIYAIGAGGTGEYDPVLDTWMIKSPMPDGRGDPGVAVGSNNRIYVIGGASGGSWNLVDEYDPATDTWVSKAPMPTPRTAHAVATGRNGKIYAVGGYNSTWPDLLNVVDEYDPATNTWTSQPNMPTARYYPAAAGAAGRIYVFGGYNPAFGGPLNIVESLTLP